MIKKKKKNKFLPLLILIVLVVLLWIGYSVMSAANRKAEAERLAEEAAKNEPTMIAEYDYTTVSVLSYTKKGQDELKFYQSNGIWTYAGDEKFPLNSETVAYMASAISQIAVERTVDEGNPADYGLTEPAYDIYVKYTDGTSHEYKIGNLNTFTGSYYFMADGDMYMIAAGLVPYFDYALESLITLDSIPSVISDTDYISEIKVKSDGDENKISDKEGISALAELIDGIPFSDWRDYFADSEELDEAYGIDGNSSVSISYKEAVKSTDEQGNETTNYLSTSYTLMFGDSDGDAGIFMSPEKSTIVYVVPQEKADEILSYIDYIPSETKND